MSDISTATLTLTWHDTQAGIDAALAAARRQTNHAMVSARLPLLSDLTVTENIALPRCWHLGVNGALAEAQARALAARLLPLERASLYPWQLKPPEILAALWLRAMAIPRQTIVVETPLTSFGVSEAYLLACAERCYGLFDCAVAHERRVQVMEGVA